MAQRTVKQVMKFTIPANKAAPAPPVGPRLGQMGVNIMQFCKDFNAATTHFVDGTPLTTTVIAYSDRSASFKIRSPPVSHLLKKAAGVQKGSHSQGLGEKPVGHVSLKQIYEIAKIKAEDVHLKHLSLHALCKSIIHSAKTCGIGVEAPPEHLRLAALQDLQENPDNDTIDDVNSSSTIAI